MIGRVVGRIITGYRVLRNGIDFPLRAALRIRRPIDGVTPIGLSEALVGLDDQHARRARALIDRYDLSALIAHGRRADILENLYYLELLIDAFEKGRVILPADHLEAIDVGVSDWFYAPAYSAVLRYWQPTLGHSSIVRPATAPDARTIAALGFEADPNRMYADGHSRADWADWFTRDTPGLRYMPEDVRSWNGTVNVATMFFPFIFPADSDRWGLPRSLFHPAELLKHVLDRPQMGGVLIIVNQGEKEAIAQRHLLASVGAHSVWSDRFESPFWSYDLPRFVHVVIKS